MKRTSIIGFLVFTAFVGMTVLFQNCSKPLQDVSGDGGGDSTCVGSGCGTGSGTIGAIISTSPGGAYANEVDMNKDYYGRYTGFTSSSDIYACAQIFTGANADCPSASHRPIAGDQGFTFTNGVGQKQELACPLSNCTFFSHTTYYGSSIQLEVANANFSQRIKRVFYIRPPHLSSGFNEVAAWYTYDDGGRSRIIHWAQGRDSIGNKLTTYVGAAEPVYFHWFTAGEDLEECTKTFTGTSVPSSTACAAADWKAADKENTVTSVDGKHKYNFHPNGFPVGRYVTFMRHASTQAVYNHATTVRVVE